MFLLAFVSCITALVATEPIAYPPQGPIQGFLRENVEGEVSSVFLGIPYAESPVAEKRFRRVNFKPTWSNPYPATQYGNACPQLVEGRLDNSPSDDYFYKYIASQSFDEDCLNLNIYYPGDLGERREGDESLAVMFWIHGGGYFVGTGQGTTDGDLLAHQTGVIVVTINYRLGAFGFLALDDPQYPGNLGLLDQRLALQWVQENIAAFGGDPGRLTIFGESAGSWSVAAHIVSPGSAGLFNQAIGQSGSLATWMPLPKAANVNSSLAIIQATNCSRAIIEDSVECLRQVPADALVIALTEAVFQGNQLSACVDDDVIPADFLERIRTGNVNQVAAMWGACSADAAFVFSFLGQTDFNPLNIGLAAEEAGLFLVSIADFFNNPEAAADELLSFYFPDGFDDVWVNLDAIIRMISDFTFEAPKATMIDGLSAAGQRTYEYAFMHRASVMREYIYSSGAFHEDEIFFVFGELPYTNGTAEEKALSKSFMNAWGTFAKTGVPLYLEADGTQRYWPRYDTSSRYYLKFDVNMSRDTAEDQSWLTNNKRLFNEILPNVGGGLVSGIDPQAIIKSVLLKLAAA